MITDLAIILIAAAVMTIVSKALKQPLILGYIVAGFLVGPHLGLFHIASSEGIELWSEIGIIFLLFALGLEFSFKKLLKVGSSALITAGVKCIGMFVLGIFFGRLMGWTTMESVFLGGLLSMSSTTIIIKAYDDMGLKNRPHATLLFGSLVFEDLIAVLLMVLLSTMAVSNQFAGGEMLMALLKLGFFLILWFVVGIFLIPLILKWSHKYLNDEIILILAIGLCFLMVTLAEAVGFSSALGAFVMGSILAETIEGERIEHAVGGIKDLFGAIFFVSVGMMVDPAVIGAHWQPILIITLIAMGGILLFSTMGALLTGQGLKNSLHIGFSLAQLGEFAFIIAGLGCSLGVMRDFIYPVVIAVSVLTTFTTPYMIKAADPVADWLCWVLPQSLVQRLSPSADEHKVDSAAAENEMRHVVREVLIRLLIFGVLLVAATLISARYLSGWLHELFPDMGGMAVSWVATLATLVVMVPLIIGLLKKSEAVRQSTHLLIKEKSHNRWSLAAIVLLRVMVAFVFVAVAIYVHLGTSLWGWLLLLAAVVLVVLLVKNNVNYLEVIEHKFLENLNEKERADRAARPITTSLQDKLAGYSVHIEAVTIQPEFAYVGKMLREMPFRHVAGVNIVELMRGERCIRVPRGSEVIYPHDVLLAVGTSEQIAQMRAIVEENTHHTDVHDKAEFVVKDVILAAESPLLGKSLRETGLRAAGCLVVSILRDGKLITNPEPDEKLLLGDRIWLAGEKASCEFYC